MRIHYEWGTDERYCEKTDEMIGGSVGYTYEPDLGELRDLICNLVAREYKIPYETAKKMISDLQLDDACEEYFEEDIKEYFEEDAYEECFGG